jgi:GPH family glycoside/pentoside/hexuronide:cation symporter
MSTSASPEPALTATASRQIGTARMILYAMSGFGIGCADFIVAVYLLKYYTDHVALSAMLAGAALMIGKLLDGASDPVMGYISDRTKTRWGRRRPWFLVGAAPLALSFIALFSAEAGWSQTQLFLWLLSWNVLFWSAQTVVNVPHAALAGEMVEGHNERNAIMGWREALSQLGLLIGAAAPLLVLGAMQDAAAEAALASGLGEEVARSAGFVARGDAHSTMAWQFAGLIFVGVVLSFLGTREPQGPRTPPRDSIFGDFADTLKNSSLRTPPRDSIFGDFADTLKNSSFRLFVVIFVFDQIAGGLTATLVLYTIRDWWKFEGPHEMLLIMSFLLSAVVSIPFWVRAGRAFPSGYARAAVWRSPRSLPSAASCRPARCSARRWCRSYGLGLAYAGLIGSGFGVGARAVMAMSTMPDIIDEDELRTGTRKDGAYFGMWSLLRKLCRALSIGAAGLGLSLWGYQEGGLEQPESALRGIMWMFAIIPAIASVIAGLLFLRLPLTRARHEDTLAALDRHRERGRS